MTEFPTTAQAVVVGGGIIGCSTAYHLAKLGWEVVLLERHKLTSGTTFHAAGLVGQLRSSARDRTGGLHRSYSESAAR